MTRNTARHGPASGCLLSQALLKSRVSCWSHGRSLAHDLDLEPRHRLGFLKSFSWRWLRRVVGKIGTRIVAEIERSHKGRQLMAVSQDSESDRFWATLGWQRHEHSVLAGTRALYVAQINDAS